MDFIQLLGLDITRTVNFVLFGARYSMELWKLGLLVGIIDFFVLKTIFVRIMNGAPLSMPGLWNSSFGVSVIAAPIIEETIHRLVAIPLLFYLTGSVTIAIFISAFLFGLAHMARGSFRFLDAFVAGLIFGVLFVNFGVVVSIIAHATNNFLANAVRV